MNMYPTANDLPTNLHIHCKGSCLENPFLKVLPLTDFMEELPLRALECGEIKTTTSCVYIFPHWRVKDEIPQSSTCLLPRETLSTFMKFKWNP